MVYRVDEWRKDWFQLQTEVIRQSGALMTCKHLFHVDSTTHKKTCEIVSLATVKRTVDQVIRESGRGQVYTAG